jgi:hypothetical protein
MPIDNVSARRIDTNTDADANRALTSVERMVWLVVVLVDVRIGHNASQSNVSDR